MMRGILDLGIERIGKRGEIKQTGNPLTSQFPRMGRNGEITTNNVLSLIVAVIGIAILFFGIVKLYGIYASNEERNAQTTLDRIVAKIDSLEKGEYNEFNFQGFKGGENWELQGFGKDNTIDKCLFESCLCVCEKEKDCQEFGVCRKLDYDKISVKKYLFGGNVAPVS